MFYKNVGKGENGLVHYVFTIILTILGYILGQIPLTIAIGVVMYNNDDVGASALAQFEQNPDFSLLHMDKNLGLLLILMSFVFAIVLLFIGVKYIHKRKIITLFNSSNRIDWNRVIWGTVVWFVLLAVVEVFFYFQNPEFYSFRKPDSSFIFLILISLLILPIQTTFEELFTRGYILQSVSYNSKNIFLGFTVSVFIFALLHGLNPETVKYGFWPMMSYYIIAGILLGLVVVFDKRLELAIGIHTATNIFGALMVTYDGAALQTNSLYITSKIDPVLLAFEMLFLGIIFIYVSAKKYKWNFSKSFHYDLND